MKIKKFLFLHFLVLYFFTIEAFANIDDRTFPNIFLKQLYESTFNSILSMQQPNFEPFDFQCQLSEQLLSASKKIKLSDSLLKQANQTSETCQMFAAYDNSVGPLLNKGTTIIAYPATNYDVEMQRPKLTQINLTKLTIVADGKEKTFSNCSINATAVPPLENLEKNNPLMLHKITCEFNKEKISKHLSAKINNSNILSCTKWEGDDSSMVRWIPHLFRQCTEYRIPQNKPIELNVISQYS